jgi:hypothetical protein
MKEEAMKMKSVSFRCIFSGVGVLLSSEIAAAIFYTARASAFAPPGLYRVDPDAS